MLQDIRSRIRMLRQAHGSPAISLDLIVVSVAMACKPIGVLFPPIRIVPRIVIRMNLMGGSVLWGACCAKIQRDFHAKRYTITNLESWRDMFRDSYASDWNEILIKVTIPEKSCRRSFDQLDSGRNWNGADEGLADAPCRFIFRGVAVPSMLCNRTIQIKTVKSKRCFV